MNYLDHFERSPQVCGGQWVIKGTRVPMRTVLASLAEGANSDEIIADFPTLKEDDIRSVIAFAAASVEGDLPVTNIPAFP